jgi:type IV pilus modification protein PilV
MSRHGQSLIEILVATAVGTILLGGTLAILVPALRSNGQAQNAQTAAALGRELMDNVRTWSDANWNNIYSLNKGATSTYYLMTSSSPFTATSGTQSVMVGTTTYSRYFFVTNVNRNGSGQIVTSGGSDDPATQKVTVAYLWPDLTATRTLTTYVTRSRTQAFWQTDWSGGSGQDGPATSTNSQFASSTNVDFSTTTGGLRISGI